MISSLKPLWCVTPEASSPDSTLIPVGWRAKMRLISLCAVFAVLRRQGWRFVPVAAEVHREKVPGDGDREEEVSHQEGDEETFGEGNHQTGRGCSSTGSRNAPSCSPVMTRGSRVVWLSRQTCLSLSSLSTSSKEKAFQEHLPSGTSLSCLR